MALEKRRPHLEYLAKVGADVRCRALEQAKGRRLFRQGKDKFSNIRGEVDAQAIEKGNIACHCGYLKADWSLFVLRSKFSKDDAEFFSSIYGIKPWLVTNVVSSKAEEAIDLRGTMAFCFSFTQSSRSPGVDTSFLLLFEKIRMMWSVAQSRSENADIFDSDPEVEKKLVLMRRIVGGVKEIEKRSRYPCDF